MVDTIKLATARELAAAGSLRDTTVTAEPGGYVVTFALENSDRALATKDGTTRLFSGVQAAARVLAQLGITRYRVDATAIAGAEPSRRLRPDRSRALKQLHEDSAYLERIREAVAEARADSRPALSRTDAHLHMAALKARLGDELQTALKPPSSTK
ncbi:hypothetical protein [Stenotrophomonas sp. TWI587]|uniref:hypothetical protein n=1 Tax=Stenotrophomonas sp. TWI587 TaxID=3136783 RepID=UPI00320B06FB